MQFNSPNNKFKKSFKKRKDNMRRRVEPFSALLPHLITITAICCGITSIKFAINQNWTNAISAILVAAFLDGIDGKVARMLGTASHFGAELDSFADVINFGIAPSLVMYFFILHTIGDIGWGGCLFYCICMVLRLARFNVMAFDESKKPYWANSFCIGLPAPAAASFSIISLIFFKAFNIIPNPYLVLCNIIMVGFFMVSTIPTLSLKKIPINPKHGLLVILTLVICLIFLFSYPWYSLLFIISVYIITMPLVYRRYLVHKKSLNNCTIEQK